MSVSNVNSYASSMSTTAWWIAFAFTLTATVVFLVLSYIRNVKPEARLVRLPFCPRSRAPPLCVRSERTPANAVLCDESLCILVFDGRERVHLVSGFVRAQPSARPRPPSSPRRSTTW